ncbi:uncharacterized protein RAG0_00444 [Rhynchosporium agropyri]|uniref:2EXR domain-containing protein n=1 Tax=Rhynchosporium agropyri TaxID=914238 RepID=A0A1E1JSN2_9HELO|nr:uncharacterized protein RAG0_00444 [Rhynchosporium agropyri]
MNFNEEKGLDPQIKSNEPAERGVLVLGLPSRESIIAAFTGQVKAIADAFRVAPKLMTFQKFPKLPIELRTMFWDILCRQIRLMQLNQRSHSSYDVHSQAMTTERNHGMIEFTRNSRAPSVVFQICQESRAKALHVYTLFQTAGLSCYISQSSDIIYVGGKDACIRTLASSASMNFHVTGMAIDLELPQSRRCLHDDMRDSSSFHRVDNGILPLQLLHGVRAIAHEWSGFPGLLEVTFLVGTNNFQSATLYIEPVDATVGLLETTSADFTAKQLWAKTRFDIELERIKEGGTITGLENPTHLNANTVEGGGLEVSESRNRWTVGNMPTFKYMKLHRRAAWINPDFFSTYYARS